MNKTAMITPHKGAGRWKLALLSLVMLTLTACGATETTDEPADGMASIQVSIPGLQRAAKGAARTAAREGVPAELTSLLIEVLNSQQVILASAEVIGSDGNVSLRVPAGKNYIIRGSGLAGDELVFSGQTPLEEIAVGARTSVNLSLLEQVSLDVTAPGDIAAGTTATAIDFNLTGLKNDAITWYVNDSVGGSAEFGFIDANGVYRPPATAPANTLVTIKAEPVATPSFAQSFSFNLLPAVNTAPIARAGGDQSVYERSTVTLNGNASSDAQGAIASYRWTQTAGQLVTLDRNDAAQVSFSAPAVNDSASLTLAFELTVTDSDGLSSTDSVQIQINDLPNISIANASITEGNSGSSRMDFNLTLQAYVSDVTLQYATQDGSASSASDYVATSGTVIFSNAASSQTVSVDINGDSDVETDETFDLLLSALSGSAEFSIASATGTILNDDVIIQPGFDMALQTTNYDPNGLNPFTLTITFPSPVSGFDAAGFSLVNASLTSLSSNDNTVYTAVIQPTINGTISVNIPAGSVIDGDGSSNNALTELRLPFFDWVFNHPYPTTADLESIAFGAGRCVIGGWGGNVSEILTTTSRITGIYGLYQRSPFRPADPLSPNIRDIQYTQIGGGLYLATGKDGFYSSTDTSTWTFNPTVNSQNGEEFSAIAEGNDGQPLLLAVGGILGQISISRDGLSWSGQDYSAALQTSEFVDLFDVIWDGSQFVAVGSRYQFFSFSNSNGGSIILTSPDGVTWSAVYRSFVDNSGFSNVEPDFLYAVTLGEDGNGNTRWLAMGSKGVIVTSGDGVNWNAAATTLGDSIRIESVKWSANQYIAVGSDSSTSPSVPVMYRSSNGVDWTQVTLPAEAMISTGLADVEVCSGLGNLGQDAWLAVGKQGAILSSDNGISWSNRTVPQFTDPITAYTQGDSQVSFLQLAETQNSSGDTLYLSNNGINWSAGFNEEVLDLSYLNGTFYAITRDANIGNWSLKASSDGLSWSERVNVSPFFPTPQELLRLTLASGVDLWALGAKDDNKIQLSNDGINWNSQPLSTALDTAPAIDTTGKRLIAAINNQLVSSENGIDWTPFGAPFCGTSCPFTSLNQVFRFGNRYLVWGENFAGEGASDRQLIVSDDNGQSWSSPTLLPGSCFTTPTLKVIGDLLTLSCGQLYVSLNGVDWVEILAPFSNTRMGFANGNYRLFGDRGGLMSDREPDT